MMGAKLTRGTQLLIIAIAMMHSTAHGTTRNSKLLVLTYVFGTFSGHQNNSNLLWLLNDSLKETGSHADLVVLTPDSKSDEELRSFHSRGINVEVVPDHLKSARSFSQQVLFRFTAWRHYINKHRSDYTHVFTTDGDVFVQLDPLKCLPQHRMLQASDVNW